MNRLLFDVNNQVDIPTLILESKGGTVYGSIDGATGITYTRSFLNPNELSFDVPKYIDGKRNALWDNITDLKTVYIPEYQEKFQIKVTYNDEELERKSVSGIALAESELSQILLREFACNTDSDLELQKYEVTRFYDEENPTLSLLHRVLSEKASHYKIGTVDDSLKNLAYEYTANEKSIYDFLVGDVAEQMQCLFLFDSMTRTIHAYDLLSTCNDCFEEEIGRDASVWKHYRDDFHDICPKCQSTNITEGYGHDTTILIDKENLAASIVRQSDIDSLKNCLYVDGGDDMINAAFIMSNPNGSQYIYYFSPEVLAEMPEEFLAALKAYDDAYADYYYKHTFDAAMTTHEYCEDADGSEEVQKAFDPSNPDSNYVAAFNNVVNTISSLSANTPYSDFKSYESGNRFTGQSALVTAYYNSIDLESFIQTTMGPTYEMEVYDKYHALSLLTPENLGDIAISGFGNGTTKTVVENAILQAVKTVINTALFQVKIDTSTYHSGSNQWVGTFAITDLQNDNTNTNTITNSNFTSIAATEGYQVKDTISASVLLKINDDMETYCKNRIQYLLSKSDLPVAINLYELDPDLLPESEFEHQITLYSIDNLKIIYNVMQSCMEVLSQEIIEIADTSNDVYEKLNSYYQTYLSRQKKITERINLLSGYLLSVQKYGLLLKAYLEEVQKELNFQTYLENYSKNHQLSINLWDIFNSYRREDTYRNENILSDNLESNAELLQYAGYLMDFAKKEAVKAGTPQITISTTLNNLLTIPEFRPILNHFDVGNWIRVRTDIRDDRSEDSIYKLRLLSYQISFDDVQTINVEFSTATNTWSGLRDVQDMMDSAQSMATSYTTIAKQVDKNESAAATVNHWVNDGLDLTNQKIVNTANGQNLLMDEHGLMARKYDELSDTYDPCQLKIFNNGLYTTHDNWKTLDAAVGKFMWKNPDKNWQEEETYGIIARKIVGEQILGEDFKIVNETGSMTFDGNGLNISNGTNSIIINPNDNDGLFKIENGSNNNVFYTDNEGNLNVTGKINGCSFNGGSININNRFIVDDNGNVTLPPGTSISWKDVTETDNVATKSYVADQGYQTAAQVTQITKDTVTTSYVNALKVTADSVAAENLTGTTISGKIISGGSITGNHISGGSITIGDETSFFSVDSYGNMNSNSAIFVDGIYATYTYKGNVQNKENVLSFSHKASYEFNTPSITDGMITWMHTSPILGAYGAQINFNTVCVFKDYINVNSNATFEQCINVKNGAFINGDTVISKLGVIGSSHLNELVAKEVKINGFTKETWSFSCNNDDLSLGVFGTMVYSGGFICMYGTIQIFFEISAGSSRTINIRNIETDEPIPDTLLPNHKAVKGVTSLGGKILTLSLSTTGTLTVRNCSSTDITAGSGETGFRLDYTTI